MFLRVKGLGLNPAPSIRCLGCWGVRASGSNESNIKSSPKPPEPDPGV